MKYIVVFLGVLAWLANFKTSVLYADLCRNHIVNTNNRPSLKILNNAYVTASALNKVLVRKCLKWYTFYLILFYSAVIGIAIEIIIGIKDYD